MSGFARGNERFLRRALLCAGIFLAVHRPGFPVFSAVLGAEAAHREEVRRELVKLTTRERAFLQRGFDNASSYIDIAKDALRRRGLPEELAFLPLIESGYSVSARSRAGAVGMWQFMAQTARMYGLRVDHWVDERRDPFTSSEKAAHHLSDLHARFGDWELALAAYNAGARAVEKAVQKAQSRDFWEISSLGLFKRETREYVPRFYAAAIIAENAAEYGFQLELGAFPDYEFLRVDKAVDVTALGGKLGLSAASLSFLNPELRWMMTPFGEAYHLRIPKGHLERARSAYRELPEYPFRNVKQHRVKSGETLGEIAARYGADIRIVKTINGIGDAGRIRAGDRLLVPAGSAGARGGAVREEGIGESDMGEGEDPAETPSAPVVLRAQRTFGAQAITYRIKRGDTVWSIAQKYGAGVEQVLAANGFTYESVIVPGDEIKLWIRLPFRP